MRLIIDKELKNTILYYKTFSYEPTIEPRSNLKITLDSSDILDSPTLESIVDRLLAGKDDEALICCHGTSDGPLVEYSGSSTSLVDKEGLGMLVFFVSAIEKIKAINLLPADKQSSAWHEYLKKVRIKKKPIIKNLGNNVQDKHVYVNAFNQYLNLVATELQFTNSATFRVLIDKLISLQKRNFKRLEFRSCHMGEDKAVMKLWVKLFDCKQVVAPDVINFGMKFSVRIKNKFDEIDYSDKVTRITNRAARKNIPSSMYKENSQDLPETRAFDTVTKRSGNEVFLRIWQTDMFKYAGWLVAEDKASLRNWVKQSISSNTTSYSVGNSIPIVGMWLRKFDNSPVITKIDLNDPLGGLKPNLPYSLPMETAYTDHLVSVSK